jgi:peptide deformylase
MAILPITIYGDKILKTKTKYVKQVDDEIIRNIKDMFQTMRHASGIGLAANQVGLDKSIFVIDISPIEGFEESEPIAMINPVITAHSDDSVIYEEGCLSLPALRADVERPEIIEIKYLDPDENEKIIEADEWLARVIQHEYDHLIGKMIPDRVTPEIKKMLKSQLADIMNRKVEVDYETT